MTSPAPTQGVAEADRIVKFVISLSVEREEGGEEAADTFLERMMETLIPLTTASSKSVRFRAAGLLAGIMNSLSSEAELDGELLDKLAETMRERLRDKAPEVRQHAARALSRLQARTKSPLGALYLSRHPRRSLLRSAKFSPASPPVCTDGAQS